MEYSQSKTCSHLASLMLESRLLLSLKLSLKNYYKKVSLFPLYMKRENSSRSKKDGSYRTTLNLKKFNEFVGYRHFKMDTLDTVIKLMTPGCYMVSIDLKDAYYLLPIHKDHQKFLKFKFKVTLYQYTCLPNVPQGYFPNCLNQSHKWLKSLALSSRTFQALSMVPYIIEHWSCVKYMHGSRIMGIICQQCHYHHRPIKSWFGGFIT